MTGVTLAAMTLASAEARSMADIRESKTLLIGINGNIPPFQYKIGTTPSGYEIELVKIIVANMGLTPVFVEYPVVSDMTAALAAGKVDVGLATIASTSTREKSFDLTQPYACLGAALMTTDPKVKTQTDLKGKRVGVVKNSVFETYAKKLPIDLTVMSYETRDEHAAAFLSGKYDVAIGWKGMIPFLAKVFKVPFQDTPTLWSIPVAMILQDGDAALKARLNTEIIKLRRDQRYTSLNEKMFPGETVSCQR